jgi:hypothetical protein
MDRRTQPGAHLRSALKSVRLPRGLTGSKEFLHGSVWCWRAARRGIGTGPVGRAVIRELLARGHRVRAMSHDQWPELLPRLQAGRFLLVLARAALSFRVDGFLRQCPCNHATTEGRLARCDPGMPDTQAANVLKLCSTAAATGFRAPSAPITMPMLLTPSARA